MRRRAFLLLTTVISACSAPAIEGTPVGGGKAAPRFGEGDGGLASPGFDPDARLRAGGGGLDGGLGMEGPDTDGDGVPDAFDCDPGSSAKGALLIDDDLATARGLIEAAPSFDPGAWVHGGGGYQQSQLRNGADASFFRAPPASGLVVDVRVVSTRTGTFSPTLHQDFVVFGAAASGGQFSAFGCGVEFVEGSSPMGVASIVHLDGTPGAMRTTPIKREGRPFLAAGQQFGINLRVQQGTIQCTVQQAEATTTVAAQVNVPPGAIGFYTHQAAALFKGVRVCIAS